MNTHLPSGTVTFLFTDIEGSTRLWEQHPQAMRSALARHDFVLKEAIESNRGHIVKTTGDGVHAVFTTALEAINAAIAAQRVHDRTKTAGVAGAAAALPLRVRMGLHTGEAQQRDGDYYGSVPNRAARLMSAAHGGQILLSSASAKLVREQLPANTTLRDLGEHRLKDLIHPEHVFQIIHPDLQSDFPPIESLGAFPSNLPTQLTSFIGRTKEKAEVKALLASSRLVTVTGIGGTGKTRISIEVGAEELPSFVNGVWLIELAPLADPAQIMPALAQAFGLQELPSRSLASLVVDYLRDKELLLVLDNCEHLVAACAALADDLLRNCAGLKILASSREALGIAGEAAYHMSSLTGPEAVRLFVERARAVNPRFALTDANTASVAQVCARLDGIPLAIELAAARVRLLAPEQIAARLDDRFRLLVGGSRTALPRQQTLRALIDWSYDLLAEEEKRLLQFASVFVDGWTLGALEVVAGDGEMPFVLELLEQLVNKSLVVTEAREGQMRFSMLETIRQYAREKLFEARQVVAARDRHFAYFTELSEQMWDDFRSADVVPLVKRATDEVENFRAALEWGIETHVDETIRLAANYCLIAYLLGIAGEGITWATNAVERARGRPPTQGDAEIRRQRSVARALYAQGLIGFTLGKMPLAIQALQEAIAISRVTGDKQILGYSLAVYYITTRRTIHAPDGDEAAREALTIFSREVTDNFGLRYAYLNMARLAAEKGDEGEKQEYFGKLKDMIPEMPLSFQLGLFYLGMGREESARGNYESAQEIFRDGLDLFKGVSNLSFRLVLESELAHTERRLGNLTAARSIYGHTITDWQELGNRSAIAHQLECFAFLAIADEEPQRAIRLLSAAEALRQEIQSPRTDQEQIEYGQAIAHLRSMLDEIEFDALWAEGRSMTMKQAIQYALNAEPRMPG